MKPLISIKNLTIDLPPGAQRPHAIQNLSLDVHQGEILCVVGESGSGKSLTAGAILGLLPEGIQSSTGQIIFEDRDLLGLHPEAMRQIRGKRIGMIFQEPMTALNPLRTVGDQIGEVFRTHTQLSGKEIAHKTLELIESVHIPSPLEAARAYPHELSGGQRQRAMIAMALAMEPALLIADEPTTALDVTTQAQILHLIHDLQRRKGTAVLFITHDFGVVAEIADRVAVMQHGHLVEQGLAHQVLNQPVQRYTQELIAAVPPLHPPDLPAVNSSPNEEIILSIENISKIYRARGWLGKTGRVTHALNDVSLNLIKGKTLGIVGESGSGKSTLARILMGLVTPDSGTLILGGQPMLTQGAALRRIRAKQIQMVFQDPFGSLNPRHRVGDIVAQGPIIHGVPRAQAYAKARELFDLVGLDANALTRYPHEFSGGQRQRIGLARALALEPEVLVADEPVSALDVSVQAQVLRLLADLRTRLGLSIIFITHDLRVAAQVCDQIAVMKDGNVVEQGNCQAVFERPSHSYTQSLLAAVPGRNWNPTGVIRKLAA